MVLSPLWYRHCAFRLWLNAVGRLLSRQLCIGPTTDIALPPAAPPYRLLTPEMHGACLHPLKALTDFYRAEDFEWEAGQAPRPKAYHQAPQV